MVQFVARFVYELFLCLVVVHGSSRGITAVHVLSAGSCSVLGGAPRTKFTFCTSHECDVPCAVAWQSARHAACLPCTRTYPIQYSKPGLRCPQTSNESRSCARKMFYRTDMAPTAPSPTGRSAFAISPEMQAQLLAAAAPAKAPSPAPLQGEVRWLCTAVYVQ